eukprot:scaffold375385_cov33-Prasinocladus_malaysianus.AAC.1
MAMHAPSNLAFNAGFCSLRRANVHIDAFRHDIQAQERSLSSSTNNEWRSRGGLVDANCDHFQRFNLTAMCNNHASTFAGLGKG